MSENASHCSPASNPCLSLEERDASWLDIGRTVARATDLATMLVMEENPSPTAIQVLGHLTRANYCFNCDHIKQLELAKKRAGLPNDPVPEVLADDPVTVKAEPNSRPHEIELLGEYSHDSRGGEVLANKHQLLRLATAITELADSTERGRAAYYAGGRDTLIVKIPHEEGGEAAVYFSLVEENPKRDALAGCGYL